MSYNYYLQCNIYIYIYIYIQILNKNIYLVFKMCWKICLQEYCNGVKYSISLGLYHIYNIILIHSNN